MRRSLSPTPSLSLRLDQIRAARESGPGVVAAALPRWRAAADGLGMATFLVVLGAYLVVRLS